MKTKLYLSVLCLFWGIKPGITQWAQSLVPFGELDVVMINKLVCPDSAHCYACGNDSQGGRVFKTVDGVNWEDASGSLPTSTIAASFYNITCFNNSKCLMVDDYGVLYKTTNGGSSWQQIAELVSPIMQFVDQNVGFYANLSPNELYKTTNGGSSWTSISLPFEPSVITFADANTGFISSGNFIYKTTDGGVNWTQVFDGTSDDIEIKSFEIVNPSVAYAGGTYMSVLKTYDGGDSWSVLPNPNTGLYYQSYKAIDFVDENRGYMAGANGHIIKTTDGGSTWYSSDYPTVNASLHSIQVTTPEIIYASFLFFVIKRSDASFLGLDAISTNQEIGKIYPNPIEEQFTIELKETDLEDLTITLIDYTGKMVFEQAINSLETNIQRGELKSGFYTIQIKKSGSVLSSEKLMLI